MPSRPTGAPREGGGAATCRTVSSGVRAAGSRAGRVRETQPGRTARWHRLRGLGTHVLLREASALGAFICSSTFAWLPPSPHRSTRQHPPLQAVPAQAARPPFCPQLAAARVRLVAATRRPKGTDGTATGLGGTGRHRLKAGGARRRSSRHGDTATARHRVRGVPTGTGCCWGTGLQERKGDCRLCWIVASGHWPRAGNRGGGARGGGGHPLSAQRLWGAGAACVEMHGDTWVWPGWAGSWDRGAVKWASGNLGHQVCDEPAPRGHT